MKKFMAAAMIMALVGCQSTATTSIKPVFESDIRIVRAEQLDQYWVDSNQSKSFALAMNAIPAKLHDRTPLKAVFSYRYVIDSEGNIFNPEILSVEGTEELKPVVYAYLNEVNYVPAKQNVRRVPVQVTVEGMEVNLCSNRARSGNGC